MTRLYSFVCRIRLQRAPHSNFKCFEKFIARSISSPTFCPELRFVAKMLLLLITNKSHFVHFFFLSAANYSWTHFFLGRQLTKMKITRTSENNARLIKLILTAVDLCRKILFYRIFECLKSERKVIKWHCLGFISSRSQRKLSSYRGVISGLLIKTCCAIW